MFSLIYLSALSTLFLGCAEQNEPADIESPLLSQGLQKAREMDPRQTVDPLTKETSSTGLGTPLTIDIPPTLQITQSVETIRERVKYFSLRQSERVWDKIPWVTDYSTAQALSQESQRPKEEHRFAYQYFIHSFHQRNYALTLLK